MSTTLIVLAHPEPASFTAAWARATAAAVQARGGTVLWADLHAQGFDPVERRAHYPGHDPAAPFDPLKAQERAAATGTLPADVAAEIASVRAAGTIVLHFPLWWFAPPAMLKGWCERVLAHGALHTSDERFDTGRGAGTRVLFCVTTGANDDESSFAGREGESRLLLWPLAATFRYCGMTVLEPELVHGVHGYHRGDRLAALEARLAGVLARQEALVAGLPARPVWPFNADADFDARGRLRADAPSHGPFIRHAP